MTDVEFVGDLLLQVRKRDQHNTATAYYTATGHPIVQSAEPARGRWTG